MIRTVIAAWLLRTAGAKVEYRTKRIKTGSHGEGTTVLRSHKFREANAKYKAMRVAESDTVTIQVVAIVKSRHGTVAAE